MSEEQTTCEYCDKPAIGSFQPMMKMYDVYTVRKFPVEDPIYYCMKHINRAEHNALNMTLQLVWRFDNIFAID